MPDVKTTDHHASRQAGSAGRQAWIDKACGIIWERRGGAEGQSEQRRAASLIVDERRGEEGRGEERGGDDAN